MGLDSGFVPGAATKHREEVVRGCRSRAWAWLLNAVIRLFFCEEAPTGKSTQEGAGRGRLEPGRQQPAPAQELRATKNRMAQALLWQNDLCKVFIPGYEREKCWLSSFLT